MLSKREITYMINFCIISLGNIGYFSLQRYKSVFIYMLGFSSTSCEEEVNLNFHHTNDMGFSKAW
jgi:hypothetical protein